LTSCRTSEFDPVHLLANARSVSPKDACLSHPCPCPSHATPLCRHGNDIYLSRVFRNKTQLTYLLKIGYLISSRVVASIRCKGGRVLQCCMAFGRLEVDSIRTRGGRPMQVKHTSKDGSSLDPQYYRNSSAHTPCVLEEQNVHLKAVEC
jgi:hypothetical protein